MDHLDIFTQILRMAGVASIVILVVLLVRVLMRRFPRRYAYLMWLVVGIRLVCPVALSSSWSLFNLRLLPEQSRILTEDQETDLSERQETVTGKTGYPAETDISVSEKLLPDPGNAADGLTADGSMSQEKPAAEPPTSDREDGRNISDKKENILSSTDQSADASSIVARLLPAAFYLWLAGMALLLLWNLYLVINMRKRLRKAVLYRDHIYECDDIASPFVFGLLRPRIYIPFRLGEEERTYILRHEQYHIRRGDHMIKFFAFLILTVYWFHPLVWISYFCMVRDMEMSCDEYVLSSVGQDIRKEYSQSLLAFATNQRQLSIGFLAFGETDTRMRIRHILDFHKKGKWMGILAGILVLVVASVCLTNGKKGKTEDGRLIISEETINGYETKLLLGQGMKIEDESSPYNGMYKGNFALATYKGGERCDERELPAYSQENVLYFPEEFSFCVRDYDRDGEEDDFALGQLLDGSAMEYRFYTVEENGSIMSYSISSQRITDDTTEKLVSAGTDFAIDSWQESIIMKEGEDSPDFSFEYGLPSYSSYNQETGMSEKRICMLIKNIEKNRSPESELAMFRNIEKSVSEIAPQQVVAAMKNGIWMVNRTGGVENYNIIDKGMGEEETFYIRAGFLDGKLYSYKIQIAGIEDKLPKQELLTEEQRNGSTEEITEVMEKVTRKRAYETIHRFAKVMCNRTVEENTIQRHGDLFSSALSPECFEYTDMQGGVYIVNRDYNMIMDFEDSGWVEMRDVESALDAKKDQVLIGIWRQETGRAKPVYYGGSEGTEELQSLAEKLDPYHGCTEEIEEKWQKEQETGCLIVYQGNEWSVYTGGYVQFLYGKAGEEGSQHTVMYLPELCDRADAICMAELNYFSYDLSAIKDVVSAELSYRKKDGTYEKQTLTKKSELEILEDVLSNKTEYMHEVPDCPLGTAILTLKLENGDKIPIEWADDGCRVIRYGSAYYEYEDRHLSFSPDGIRALFDEIPWRGLS